MCDVCSGENTIGGEWMRDVEGKLECITAGGARIQRWEMSKTTARFAYAHTRLYLVSSHSRVLLIRENCFSIVPPVASTSTELDIFYALFSDSYEGTVADKTANIKRSGLHARVYLCMAETSRARGNMSRINLHRLSACRQERNKEQLVDVLVTRTRDYARARAHVN